MYSSEKNPGINWKDLVIKAIFLVVFLLLLVWLFPKVPNMKPFYSNVFRENIKYMQDAAESYYTTEKLPKNLGDTAEMTLQEMINKNLILPFVDENGESCDTNKSYVQVIKNKNDYTLKVNLVCPNEKNFIEKTLGCYDYCPECEELEYQFRRNLDQTKTTYSCPDGGQLENGMCNIYATDSYKATVITKPGVEYCENGGQLVNGKCTGTKTDKFEPTILSGNYTCPYGGTLSGKTCYLQETYAASFKAYVCSEGNLVNGICRISESAYSYPAEKVGYECDGRIQSSSTCRIKTDGYYYDATPKITSKKVKFTYPVSGSEYTSLGTTTEYVCTSSSNCPGYVTYYNYLKYTTTYTCSGGQTPTNGRCYVAGKTQTVSATPVYDCPDGGNLSGRYCYVSGHTSTKPATPTYWCPNDGTLSGKTCYKNSTYLAVKGNDTKVCSKGTLSNGMCILSTSYTYDPSKTEGSKTQTCPNGGNLSGSLCYINKLQKSYKPVATTKTITVTEYKWSTEKELEGWIPTGETRSLKK